MMDFGEHPPLVDTHTHLDDPAFDADRDEVLAEARAVGIAHVVNIGYKPPSWEASRMLRDRYPWVSIALGLHPSHADEFGPNLDRDLVQAIHDLKPVAIGETGFDFFRAGPSLHEQERAFRRQIEMAIMARLPLIIHQRSAGEQLMLELDRWPDLGTIVLHSFDGDTRLAAWARDRNCYIGVGGLAVKKDSIDLRELLSDFALERVLLETDSPYLPPPDWFFRRNTPGSLPSIANMLAPLWRQSADEFRRATTRNATHLFQLKTDAEFGSRPHPDS